MKKRWIILIAVVALLVVGGFAVINGLGDVANTPLESVDLTGIADGEYTGTFEHGRWTNTVAVRVENHAIAEIRVVKDVFASFITHCSDEVFRRVTEAQDTQVDAVSGATATTRAYLKAIEDALQ